MQNFNEQQWLKLLFLLADTQDWLDEMIKDLYLQVPVRGKKKFLKNNYYLTAASLAHIMERHYYKISRHPHAGKFHIPVVEILHYIREGYLQPASPMPGCLNLRRIITAEKTIGFDKYGNPTNLIVVITDTCGKIITAYPAEHLHPTLQQAEFIPDSPYQPEEWNSHYFEHR